ncbi:hypothetical protein C0Q70_19788 [Pomacea canaliculata]|uniref:Uncharacterized protein n=1 Tax=Pomacea canaliculata TaxID=400727 RepID=A0A2T7NDR0_POMCA|nr:hypothetical protein C0Q70_19788 [Pomacea canaliculata]
MILCIVPAQDAGQGAVRLNTSCATSGSSAMSPEDMEVVVAKIISLLVLTVLSVLSGLLPLRLLLHAPQLFTVHRTTVDYFLCGLRCLSGGVFLATGFLHLLPDTREKMAAVLLNMGSRTTYAVTELLIMADGAEGGAGGGGGGNGGGCTRSGIPGGRYRFYDDKAIIPSTLEELDEELAEGSVEENGGIGNGYGGGGSVELPLAGGVTNGNRDHPGCYPGGGYSTGGGYPGGNSGTSGGCGSSSGDDHDSDSLGSDTLIKEHHGADLDLSQHDLDDDLEHIPVTLRLSVHSMNLRHCSLPDLGVTRVVKQLSQADLTRRAHFRSIIYIMALSLHGIFEGLALGLQSRESSVWSLCFALCLHRCVLAFQLGMDLCGARESQGTAFLCIGTFTLISALGIVAGILFSSGAMLYTDVTIPEAILQSLASGTILYIVFFDILFKDLQGRGDIKRVSCCFVGFALMAIILAIVMGS